MPAPKLSDFLTDPKHKEERDFMQGVIDARVKEIADQWKEKRKKGKNKDDETPDDDDNDENGSFFDTLFGGKK